MNKNDLKEAIANIQRVTSNPEVMDALLKVKETETLDATSAILSKMVHDMRQEEIELADLPFDVSPVFGKHDARPTDELTGMSRNRRKELEEEHGELNTGSYIDQLVTEHKQAGENKHEFTTAHAGILAEKKEVIDKDARVAKRRIYGAVAQSLEEGDFTLDKHRKNDEGEELSSYVLPVWLQRHGIEIQNAEEIVYDPIQLMTWVQMFDMWDVVSIDQKKLERFVKADNKNRAGKNTAKFARPVPAPVTILPKFKITIGEAAGYVVPKPEATDED